jgi:hypothetical protein
LIQENKIDYAKDIRCFFEKMGEKYESKSFLDSEIEMVSDETASQVCLGYKDYTPMENIRYSRFGFDTWYLFNEKLE